jgi:hypothetical protein
MVLAHLKDLSQLVTKRNNKKQTKVLPGNHDPRETVERHHHPALLDQYLALLNLLILALSNRQSLKIMKLSLT